MARLAALWGLVAFVALLLLATPAPAASMSFIPGAESDAAASAELMEVDAVTDAAAVSESHSHHAHAQAHAADAAAVAESEGAAEAAAPGRAPAVAKNFFAHKRGKGNAFFAHDKSSKGRRMYAHHKKPQGFFAHAQKPQGFFSHVQPGTMQYRHVKGKSDRVPGGAAAPAEAEEKQDPHHRRHHKAHADKAADKAHHKAEKKAGNAPDVWDHKLKNPNAKDAFKKAAGKPVSLTEAERWDTKVAAEYAAEQARIKSMSQKMIPASNPPKSVFNVAPGLKKIHVEVQTVAHGGAGANELLRIEDQFDHTHARIMSGLSRLLLRVNRAHEAETKRMQKEDQKDAEATIKLMRAKLAKRAEKKKAEAAAAAAKKKAQAPAPAAAAAAPKKK